MSDPNLTVRIKADNSGLVGEVRASAEEVNRFGGAVDRAGRSSGQAALGTDRLGRAQRGAAGDTRRLKDEQMVLGRQLDSTTRQVNWLRLAILALATGMGASMVNSFIDAASETENLRVRLRFLTDDADAAADAVLGYAAKVPFTFQQIQQAAPILLTVSRNQEEFNKLLEISGDIAAVSGLSFLEAAQQIQRSFSAGINSADLFRERGVRAMLQFQAGVETSAEATREHILGLWEDGSFALVGAAIEMADTWTGLTSMLGDKWFQFKNVLMDGEPFDFLKGVAAETNQRLDAEFGSIEEAADRMGVSLVDTVIDVAIGAAAAADALTPVVEGIFDVFDRMIDTWNELPALVKEFGIIGMFMLGFKGRVLLAASLAFGEDIADAADAYADGYNRLRGDLREALGLERDGGMTGVRLGPTIPADEAAALAAGDALLQRSGEFSISPLDRSLFGSSTTRNRDWMTDFVASVRENIGTSRNRDRPSFGSPAAGGAGGGGADAPSKADLRIDDLLFELEMMNRAQREQAILTELRKAGAEATIEQGQSLEAYLLGLSAEERALADAAGRLFDRQQAAEAQVEADKRHAGALTEIEKRLVALMPAHQRAIAQAQAWRTATLAALDETAEGYEEFAADVEHIFDEMLAEAYEEDLQNRRDWATGVERALRDVADAAADQASSFEDLTLGSLDRAEDAWVEFVRNRKLSLDDLGAFIEDWFLRYSFQQGIAPGLQVGADFLRDGGADILGSIVGSLFDSGGGAPAGGGPGATGGPVLIRHRGGSVDGGGPTRMMPHHLFGAAPRFHGGGTILGPGEVPIVARTGETVLTAEQLGNASGLISALAAIAAQGGAGGGSNITLRVIDGEGREVPTQQRRTAGGDLDITLALDQTVARLARQRGSETHRALRDLGAGPRLRGT